MVDGGVVGPLLVVVDGLLAVLGTEADEVLTDHSVNPCQLVSTESVLQHRKPRHQQDLD